MGAMFYYGGITIIKNALTVGELVAFLTYMLPMTWPLCALGFIIGDIQRSLADASRLFEVIDYLPQSVDAPDAIEFKNPRGEVEFRDDPRTDMLVQDAMLKLMEGRTSIIIARRLSIVHYVDKVVVIENGEIVEEGSPETLLGREGYLHRLYASQMKEA